MELLRPSPALTTPSGAAHNPSPLPLPPPPPPQPQLFAAGALGGDDPLTSHPLADMTFLADLGGSSGAKGEAEDFLDLFLKESMNDEL